LDNHESNHDRPEVTPGQGPADDAAPAPEPTMGEWLRANLPTLTILGALFVFLYIKFDTDGLWAIAKAAIGLGLVIFVHELGHFLVAKWCDVHVTVFSIGFGPAIPGCSFKRGETTYKLALFPLGGYVQMVGQVDGDEATDDESVNDPRSYRNKSVGQRMAIISAGVIMNVILAVICFIVVFQGPGKDRKAGGVGAVDPGGPAWKQGVPSGVVIRDIGGVEDPYFEDLMIRVMATHDGERVMFRYEDPYTKKEQPLEIEPRKTATDPKPMLGIAPPQSTQLELRRYASKTISHPAFFRSAAARANPPLEFGDRIVATTDPDDPSLKVTELPPDPRKPGSDQRDYFKFVKRMRQLAGKEITLVVERTDADGKRARVAIKVPPAYHTSLGARMEMGQIVAVRKGSPAGKKADKKELRPLDPEKSPHGDIIQMVEVPEPDGTVTRFGPPVALVSALFAPPWLQAALVDQARTHSHPLDPARLPDQLLDWSARMARAGKGKQRVVTLHVRGPSRQNGDQELEPQSRVVRLEWDEKWEDNIEMPMSLNSPLSIPGLGLAYRIKTRVAGVDPTPAEARGPGDPLAKAWAALGDALGTNALRPGDVIKKYRYAAIVNDKGEIEKGSWAELKPEQWARVSVLLQQLPNITQVDLQVERDGKTVQLTVYPWEDRSWPLEDRGWFLATDTRRQKADGFVDAIGLGLKDTKNSMIQVFQNLRGMIVGRISVENLGGPITIGRVAYYFAGLDFWEFVFFLGLISVNLAVINFLPIPVLDGGHMVFLLYEKIRGKPASEGVRVGATYAGLLLLASLMIFVLFLDIKRLL
jgi:regulator of sigma E protease